MTIWIIFIDTLIRKSANFTEYLICETRKLRVFPLMIFIANFSLVANQNSFKIFYRDFY